MTDNELSLKGKITKLVPKIAKKDSESSSLDITVTVDMERMSDREWITLRALSCEAVRFSLESIENQLDVEDEVVRREAEERNAENLEKIANALQQSIGAAVEGNARIVPTTLAIGDGNPIPLGQTEEELYPQPQPLLDN